MNGVLLAICFAAGIALGLFFFGGLWLTVVRLPKARHPAILVAASFWIRAIAVVVAAFLCARHGWQLALALLAGFAAGRFAVSLFVPGGRPGERCT